MKKKIIEFLKLPPIVALICLALYVLIDPYLKAPAEKMSVETFMYYHSAAEIAEYFDDNYELNVLAEAVEDASDGEYYSMYYEEADDLVNQAYAYGYYHGAIRESEYREEWGNEGYYQELTDAINNDDFDTIYDYTCGSYSASDFLK